MTQQLELKRESEIKMVVLFALHIVVAVCIELWQEIKSISNAGKGITEMLGGY